MKRYAIAVLAACGGLAAPAAAKDSAPCGTDLVCASAPVGVAASLMRAGYQADLGKDSTGDPMIKSAASGYKFSIFFYGCDKNVACDSLQFVATFDGDPSRGPAFANSWNAKKRFMQMAIKDSGSIEVSHDVATIGGLTQKNFADECDWWQTMLGELSQFFAAHPIPDPAKPVPTPASGAAKPPART